MLSKNDLKFLIPIIPAFFIACGIIQQTIYYSAFGIKINNFIDLTEAITTKNGVTFGQQKTIT